MAVRVSCRCGKRVKTFIKMNKGDIETYDCDDCPVVNPDIKIEEKPKEMSPRAIKWRETREKNKAKAEKQIK